MTSNGIFQQTLLVLLGEILPQNILKKLKNSRIPTPYPRLVKFVNGDGS
ncbi:MAG: hypothetical protein SPF98_00350 [Campylobacter sp.]|nr:hypothetical protein [Campylobacter sp.]